MLYLSRGIASFFISLVLFQATLSAKPKNKTEIILYYGGYEFEAEYLLSSPQNQNPLKIQLNAERSTWVARCLHGPIRPAEYALSATFSLYNTPYAFCLSSYKNKPLEPSIRMIQEKTPQEWSEQVTHFMSTAYTKYLACDSIFMSDFMRHVRPHRPIQKAITPGYTITPAKTGALLASNFKFVEYNKTRKKMIGSFSGRVIIFHKNRSDGKQETIAKTIWSDIWSNNSYKNKNIPSVTIVKVDGVIKKIKRKKISSSSIWYPHIVKRMKKVLDDSASFFETHKKILPQEQQTLR